MAENDDGSSVKIDIDFLKRFPPLARKEEQTLADYVELLKKQGIDTEADLLFISRDALRNQIPGLLLDALKPPEAEKKQRIGTEINLEQLVLPSQVVPPKEARPKFVCSSSWIDEVFATVCYGLQNTDDEAVVEETNNHELESVAPLSVVRCSRGGKSRALKEIANLMKGQQNALFGSDQPVVALYVSFNDNTAIDVLWEQDNPLQALLRRVAFSAMRNKVSFREFMRSQPFWTTESFLKWLGDTPCVLLIDELNNLDELTKEKSDKAQEFGSFLKQYFLGPLGRYMVFSSHMLGTFEFFSQYVDTSKGSARTVILQELPLVGSLEEAIKLSVNLDSAREAVYYGLIPGMIYDSNRRGTNIAGKRAYWVQEAIKNNLGHLDVMFRAILRSLIDGHMSREVPTELSMLLDSVGGEANRFDRIRWVPYHLQFVLSELSREDFKYRLMVEELSKYCNLLKFAKEKSGEGWESIFVLVLVARCLNRLSCKTFVPDRWFATGERDVEVQLNCYDAIVNRNKAISECTTWDEMKGGVVLSDNPCMNVLYPTHNSFEVYDVIVVFSQDRKIQDLRGYQLKENKASRKHRAHRQMDKKSIFVQGDPPQSTANDEKGWVIPCKAVIDAFFGTSGKHWTPEKWKKLAKTT